MEKFLQGLSNVTKIVFSVVKAIIAFAILIWLMDKIFGMKLNVVQLDFINKVSSKELTIIVVLALIYLGFREVK